MDEKGKEHDFVRVSSPRIVVTLVSPVKPLVLRKDNLINVFKRLSIDILKLLLLLVSI